MGTVRGSSNPSFTAYVNPGMCTLGDAVDRHLTPQTATTTVAAHQPPCHSHLTRIVTICALVTPHGRQALPHVCYWSGEGRDAGYGGQDLMAGECDEPGCRQTSAHAITHERADAWLVGPLKAVVPPS